MKYAIIMACIVLAGCQKAADGTMTTEHKDNTAQVNQCIRTEVFYKCLSTVPAGPVATKYNDWSEVVEECSSTARFIALRKYSTIPLECRVD
jgi:hypothetical protein